MAVPILLAGAVRAATGGSGGGGGRRELGGIVGGAAPVIQLEGARELAAVLRRLPRKIQGKTQRDATRAGAVLVRREAKSRAPVDTGRLRKKIILRTVRARQRGEVRVAVGIHQDAYYGRFVEYGTRKLRARPFIRPAFEATKDKAARQIMAEVWRRAAAEYRKGRRL